MNLTVVYTRERVVKAIRAFFDEQGFHEVIVPVLNNSVPLEPNLYPFTTTWKTRAADRTLYLSISPERYLKQLLSHGISNCYTIGHTFRNLESAGPRHTPEFLMLEWYRRNATYPQIMADTQALIQQVSAQFPQPIIYRGTPLDLRSPWQTLSLVDLFAQYAQLQIDEMLAEGALQRAAQAKGYTTAGATWSQLFDQIFLNEIEPRLPLQPFFLTDFPARMSPLCTTQVDKPHLAARFEVYLAGMELGNGNTENTNAQTVRQVFMQEQIARADSQPLDEEFLAALARMRSESYAGIGLGVDRLAMILGNDSALESNL